MAGETYEVGQRVQFKVGGRWENCEVTEVYPFRDDEPTVVRVKVGSRYTRIGVDDARLHGHLPAMDAVGSERVLWMACAVALAERAER